MWQRIETDRLLACLPHRERMVVSQRFGLDDAPATLREIGGEQNVSLERIRQIELKAIRRMRRWAMLSDATARERGCPLPRERLQQPAAPRPRSPDPMPWETPRLTQVRRLPIEHLRLTLPRALVDWVIFPNGPRTIGDLMDSSQRQLAALPGHTPELLAKLVDVMRVLDAHCFLVEGRTSAAFDGIYSSITPAENP